VELTFYSSAFCGACSATRVVLEDVRRLVPDVLVTERDVVRNEELAEADGIRSTPTVIITGANGEVFRAEGVPTVPQVLVAVANAL
jgi:glutaredoxin